MQTTRKNRCVIHTYYRKYIGVYYTIIIYNIYILYKLQWRRMLR